MDNLQRVHGHLVGQNYNNQDDLEVLKSLSIRMELHNDIAVQKYVFLNYT